MWNVCSPSIEIFINSTVRWWNGPQDFENQVKFKTSWWQKRSLELDKNLANFYGIFQCVKKSFFQTKSSKFLFNIEFGKTVSLARLLLRGHWHSQLSMCKVHRWSGSLFWLQLLSSLKVTIRLLFTLRKLGTKKQNHMAYGVLTSTIFRLTPSPEYFRHNTIKQLGLLHYHFTYYTPLVKLHRLHLKHFISLFYTINLSILCSNFAR